MRTNSSARRPAARARRSSAHLGETWRRRSRHAQPREGILYRELYAPHLKAIEGLEDLIAEARSQGIAGGGTAAPPANVEFTLDGLDLRRHFDTVVGALDVPRGKPHPDVFLKRPAAAARSLPDCIVFEDAPLGVEAARRAGMRAVVITTTLPAGGLRRIRQRDRASSPISRTVARRRCSPDQIKNRPETDP
jgi:HAD superfamily hydrolase (TIGR01509 family)